MNIYAKFQNGKLSYVEIELKWEKVSVTPNTENTITLYISIPFKSSKRNFQNRVQR